MENIDFEQLRKDLIDYFGTAMFSGLPLAIMDLSKVEKASKEELIIIAQQNNYDLDNYKIRVK